MLGLIIVWLPYFLFYFRLILFPHDINVSSDRVYYNQKIDENSKLKFIYFNKEAEPKLKIIAYEAILFFVLNLILTAIIFILHFSSITEKIIIIICVVYFFVFAFIGAITKAYLFLKK